MLKNKDSILTPDVIYEDEDLIAINKPHGLLVHRSRIAMDATEFALQMVRSYVGKHVYPAHRLDRKTSGVLLFAKSKECNSEMQQMFMNRKVAKTYVAIVRGFVKEDGVIDYALTNNDKVKEAVTHYKVLEQFEINVPHNNFPTSRYSLLRLQPETGRFHQIRKHLAHIFHPIIGDRPHGCNKQNRLWKNEFNMITMMLHAHTLTFKRKDQEEIFIEAPYSVQFLEVLDLLNKRKV